MSLSAIRKKFDNRKKSDAVKSRVFIAINLPEPVVEKLGEAQKALKAYGLKTKWTRLENIHLTLKFLGDIDKTVLIAVSEVVGAAAKGFGPIRLSAKGVGVFPGVKKARVLWTGIAGQTELLAKLHETIDTGLSGIGFLPEKRRFTGHLTIGRFKDSPHPDKLIDIMKKFKDMESVSFVADAVYIIKSELTPSGPIYTELANVALAG
ncbi:MAG: RNA 2',3'-cyclic phosphodiesterase [Dissulfuribacterales bacterium]